MSYFESVPPAPGLNRLPSNPLLGAGISCSKDYDIRISYS